MNCRNLLRKRLFYFRSPKTKTKPATTMMRTLLPRLSGTLLLLSLVTSVMAQNCALEASAVLQTDIWGSEISFTISDDNGVIVEGQDFVDYTLTETAFCLDSISGCLVLEMFDSFGDGWHGASLDISIPVLGLSLGSFTLEDGDYEAVSFGVDCETEVVETEGCTDPLAFNYDPYATIDDGSCSYDCECEDVDEPVCAYDYLTGQYVTFANACEAECANAWIVAEGGCDEQPVYGCTDPEAINYNPDATDDDGSCVIVPECTENEAQVIATLQTDIWGSEVSYTISDDNGVLVDAQGVTDYALLYQYFCLGDSAGCLTLEMFDSFGDGWNGAFLDISIPALDLSLGTFTLEVGAYQAVSFGVDCETVVIETEGCTDPLAFNYDPYATIDDGSCSYDCECEDVDEPVCAYDYLTGQYVTFANACEAECANAWIVAEGGCDEQPVYGCTDPEAINYNPDATDDDGSCVIVPECTENEAQVIATLQTDIWGSEVSYTISDDNGVLVDAQGVTDYALLYQYFCLGDSAGCLTLEMFDSFGDGWNGAFLDISIPALDLSLGTFTLEVGAYQAVSFGVGCETVVIEIEGCTNPSAINYDPYATIDDGSCTFDCECEDVYDPVCAYDYFTGQYITFNNACEAECVNAWVVWDGDCADQPIYGCTDPEALNYNPTATDDDGTCAFIPECSEEETAVVIQTAASDSLNDLGIFFSLYWNLTTDLGVYQNLVYDYSDSTNVAYGCLADGCYNFYLYDYGWAPGLASAEVSLDGEIQSYAVPLNEYEAVFSLGVNTEGCEVTYPGCTDPDALNYDPSATLDNGSCEYPFECEVGEVAYVYLYTSSFQINLDIVTNDGDWVFGQEDEFNFGGVYGEMCLEEDVCYTAIVTGDSLTGTEWTEGLFAVNTAFEEIVYEEWTQEGNTWVVQFSLNNDCEGNVPNPDDIYGCTDPEADNYDALAWVDDGSCMYDNLCDGLFEVLFVLDGGLMPEEVGLNVSNEDGELLMEMDGYTGSSAGCVPAGCYTVEMLDSFGDGWNGAFAELYIDGEPVDNMSLEDGEYEMRIVGIGADCDSLDNDNTSNVVEQSPLSVDMMVFPNPGQNELKVQCFSTASASSCELVITDVEGRTVTRMPIVVSSTQHTWSIDAAHWESGVYLIQVSSAQGTVQQRWVKAP